MVPKNRESHFCAPAREKVIPKRPGNNPITAYILARPILYKEERKKVRVRLCCIPGSDNANGPHIPAQCRLPKSPIKKAVQSSTGSALNAYKTNVSSQEYFLPSNDQSIKTFQYPLLILSEEICMIWLSSILISNFLSRRRSEGL